MGSKHRFVFLLALALATTLAWGQTSRPSGWRSFFEERLLDRCSVIVRARFERDSAFGDVQLTTFKVLRTLRGSVGEKVTLVAAGAISETFRDVDRLLFLKPERSDGLFSLVDIVDLVEMPDETEATVNSYLGLSQSSDPAERRRLWRRFILDGLDARGSFSRQLAVREFERLVEVLPQAIQPDDLPVVRKALQRLTDDERTRLRTAADKIENAALGEYAGTQDGLANRDERAAFVRAIALLRQTAEIDTRLDIVDRTALALGLRAVPFLTRALRDATLRTRALRHLGALRPPDAVPEIVVRMMAARGPEREPFVDCLGQIGDDAATTPLIHLLETDDSLFRAVVFALGRVDSISSQNVLDQMAGKLGDTPGAGVRLLIVNEARSAEFRAREEKRRALAARPYSR